MLFQPMGSTMLICGFFSRVHSDGMAPGVPRAYSLTSSVCDLEYDGPETVPETQCRVQTRAMARRQQQMGRNPTPSSTSPTPTPVRPKSYGSCFVDVNLRVVVRPAIGTMMEFNPLHLHGTTRSWYRIVRACAFTASKYIHDAFEEALAGAGVERGQVGTGADTE